MNKPFWQPPPVTCCKECPKAIYRGLGIYKCSVPDKTEDQYDTAMQNTEELTTCPMLKK